jgi:hypothetical protein
MADQYFHPFQECSALQVRDQNIFRQEHSALKVRDHNIFRQDMPNYSKKQTPSICKPLPRVSMPSYDTTWSLPLYRDTSLVSKPTSNIPQWDTPCDHEDDAICNGYLDEDDSSCDGYLDLAEDFIPPRHDFSRNPRPKKEAPKTTPIEERTPLPEGFVHLHDMDVACGRGAPTMVHPGNQAYRKLIQKYEASYLCAKRSDKPVLATKVMETLKLRAVRFLRRERNHTGMGWIMLDENKIYEKVCQSLREGAPELRRKMLASDARKRAERPLPFMEPLDDQENRSPGIYSV